MRILLADDEWRVRSALRLLLRQESDVAVVGEAETVAQVLTLVDQEIPDLVLLDWELPESGGPAVLEGLRIRQLGIGVIALSGRPEARSAALEAGVDGFVSKGDPPEQLRSELNLFILRHSV